ncbi:hypothetical protein B5X24_HaOG213498 [Helicoverpa armigera]|uniref:THAP-type domain-containing protein n=1 Tax=Helicoverpa armigera TaxID=29058 RepID=A0A2W1B4W2_HELAM|nr:hypothetical protein B5X24_HaOG213498 [Helicoverpa armigera]
MPSCALIYCNTRYGTTTGPNCGLFSFPKLNRQEREKWVKFVQSERGEKKWLPSAASKLCSKHFKKDDIYRGKTGRLMLKKGAVPYSREIESANKTRQVCPSCHATLPDSFQATQSRHEQIKSIIAKVYHFLEREYEQLKSLHPETDWSPLSRVRQRAAVATGVSEPDVRDILSEESVGLLVEQKTPNKRARKITTEESSSDNDDDDDDRTSNDDDDSDKQTEDALKLQDFGPETLTTSLKPEAIANNSVNSSAVEVCSDDIVRRDKQTTISQPAPHVHTRDPLMIEVKLEEITIENEGIS